MELIMELILKEGEHFLVEAKWTKNLKKTRMSKKIARGGRGRNIKAENVKSLTVGTVFSILYIWISLLVHILKIKSNQNNE